MRKFGGHVFALVLTVCTSLTETFLVCHKRKANSYSIVLIEKIPIHIVHKNALSASNMFCVCTGPLPNLDRIQDPIPIESMENKINFPMDMMP